MVEISDFSNNQTKSYARLNLENVKKFFVKFQKKTFLDSVQKINFLWVPKENILQPNYNSAKIYHQSVGFSLELISATHVFVFRNGFFKCSEGVFTEFSGTIKKKIRKTLEKLPQKKKEIL